MDKVITPEREQYLMELNAAWHRAQKKVREAENNGTVEKDEPKDESKREKSLEEEVAEYRLWSRHGMSKEDWEDFNALYYQKQALLWQNFWRGEDYDSSCIFIVLKFRIERMIDYWCEFSHLANGDYIITQMRLATRLIDIVLGDGNEGGDEAPLPYINQRNKHRIPEVRFHENRKGELQEIRFCKAYRLLFKLLEENIMHWWD